MNPILVKRKAEVSNSRTSRNGFNSFHVCPACGYENAIKSRTAKHMRTCLQASMKGNLDGAK